jgi:galactokinase
MAEAVRDDGYTAAEVSRGALDAALERIYGEEALEEQRSRYAGLLSSFTEHFGGERALLFSSPGRTELGGNHTDHNRGHVLAASINLDTLAAVRPTEDRRARVITDALPDRMELDLRELEPREEERGGAAALLRGCAAYLAQNGFEIGGFDAYVVSRVGIGSGLSSSASVEVLIAHILNILYNAGRADRSSLAKAGKYAENRFFGKPSGLMDQLACALGAVQYIDLADPEQPKTRAVQVDFSSRGYRLCTVATGGSHADLTEAYAAIPEEMGRVARWLGVEALRDGSKALLLRRLPELRRACGDRAVLRALHFFEEDERVTEMMERLEAGDTEAYLALVAASGRSSWLHLQNCVPPNAEREQPIPLTLALSERIAPAGVFRVHGGGFAGSIQGYVPLKAWQGYSAEMEAILGEGAVTPLSIRPCGVVRVDAECLD